MLYFDFSGYSDMAIGVSQMFGFELAPNFNYPYCSSSITEFWRRWHISLGAWFRDYVYIPLGGSRRRFGQNHPQPARRLAAHRPLARRELELRRLGAVLRAASDPGKVRISGHSGAYPACTPPHSDAVSRDGRLGVFLLRHDRRRSLLAGADVLSADTSASSTRRRNTISVSAGRCC